MHADQPRTVSQHCRSIHTQHLASEPGVHKTAIYFRSLEAARRFTTAFPDSELADGTQGPDYARPASGSPSKSEK